MKSLISRAAQARLPGKRHKRISPKGTFVPHKHVHLEGYRVFGLQDSFQAAQSNRLFSTSIYGVRQLATANVKRLSYQAPDPDRRHLHSAPLPPEVVFCCTA